LTSKPTWSNAYGRSATSAFFVLVGRRRRLAETREGQAASERLQMPLMQRNRFIEVETDMRNKTETTEAGRQYAVST
jgi:hypothetical protein